MGSNPARAGAGRTGINGHQCGGPVVMDPLTSRRDTMRTLGYVAAIALSVAGAGLALLAVKSAPDVRRYLAIRQM
jgi:hypothetical protein